MSDQYRLTSAVVDARRLQLSALLPNLVGFVLTLLIFVALIWGGPLVWMAALAVLCLTLGRLTQQGSPLGALLLALAWSVCAVPCLVGAATAGWIGLLTVLVSIAPCIVAWRAVPGAYRLRSRFGNSRSLAGQHREWKVPRDARILQAIVPGLSCAIYFVIAVIAAIAGGFIGRGPGAGFALRTFAKRANRQYRKVLAVLSQRAQEVRAKDRRPPVLLFRSFMDDDMVLERRLGMLIRLLQVSRTLEEVVVDRMWTLGPVVAIGRPGAELSPLGAAREYVYGPDWQARVAVLLDQCSLAVCILGATEGLLWECRRLAARKMPVLVVVPHGDPEVLLDRWKAFSGVFPAVASIAVTKEESDFPLLVLFQPNCEPLVLTCKYQNELSYELAFEYVLLWRGLHLAAAASA